MVDQSGFRLIIWIAFLFTLDVTNSEEWGTDCPRECTCHNTAFTDLPLAKLADEDMPEEIPNYSNTEQIRPVSYAEEIHEFLLRNEPNRMVKTAICVLHGNSDTWTLFYKLPKDLEVLSLLQSPDTGPILLDRDHFEGLHQLIALDIQGFRYDSTRRLHIHTNKAELKAHFLKLEKRGGSGSQEGGQHGRIILKNNALGQLEKLRYINLEHVRFKFGREREREIAKRDIEELFEVDVPDRVEIVSVGNNMPKNMRIVSTKERQAIPVRLSDGEESAHSEEELEEDSFVGDDETSYSSEQQHGNHDISADQLIHDPDDDERKNEYPSTESRESPTNIIQLLNPEKIVLLDAPRDGDAPYQVFGEQIGNRAERFGLFSKLGDLVFLRLTHCKLTHLTWEMFKDLKSLRKIILDHNQISMLPDFVFYGMPNLNTLSLAHNSIRTLHSTALAGLLELRKLDLSHNNVSQLSELSLPPFPNLEKANFAYNPITTILPHSFEVMNTTKHLTIGSPEQPLHIMENSFQGLAELEHLTIINLHQDMLEEGLFRGMPLLNELIIRGSVDRIAFDSFLKIPKLQKLDLGYCNISSVSMDAFYGMKYLVQINLAGNMISELAPGLFDHQKSLRELLLQNNNLRQLPADIFRRLSAKMIRLEGNPWHCSCTMDGWNPTSINKIKLRREAICNDSEYGHQKCEPHLQLRYVYDHRVAPKCVSPPRYKGQSVFDALRKGLRCGRHKKEQIAALKQRQDVQKEKKRLLSENRAFVKPTPEGVMISEDNSLPGENVPNASKPGDRESDATSSKQEASEVSGVASASDEMDFTSTTTVGDVIEGSSASPSAGESRNENGKKGGLDGRVLQPGVRENSSMNQDNDGYKTTESTTPTTTASGQNESSYANSGVNSNSEKAQSESSTPKAVNPNDTRYMAKLKKELERPRVNMSMKALKYQAQKLKLKKLLKTAQI